MKWAVRRLSWQDGRMAKSSAHSLLTCLAKSRPSYKPSSWCRTGKASINVCAVPQMDIELTILSSGISWWAFTDPTVSFAKSRQGIAGNLN